MRICAADGCFQDLEQLGKRAGVKWCSDRCRKRQHERDKTGAFPGGWCEHCGERIERARRRQRFCDARCADRHRKGLPPLEPPLSPYWRAYLERFDRAIRERSSEAWAACHELAPPARSQPSYTDPDFARLLRSLEEDHVEPSSEGVQRASMSKPAAVPNPSAQAVGREHTSLRAAA